MGTEAKGKKLPQQMRRIIGPQAAEFIVAMLTNQENVIQAHNKLVERVDELQKEASRLSRELLAEQDVRAIAQKTLERTTHDANNLRQVVTLMRENGVKADEARQAEATQLHTRLLALDNQRQRDKELYEEDREELIARFRDVWRQFDSRRPWHWRIRRWWMRDEA